MGKEITCDLCRRHCGGPDGEGMVGGLMVWYDERRHYLTIDICDDCGALIEGSIRAEQAKREGASPKQGLSGLIKKFGRWV